MPEGADPPEPAIFFHLDPEVTVAHRAASFSRADHLLSFLRKTLKPYRRVCKHHPLDSTEDNKGAAFVCEVLGPSLRLALDLSILWSRLERAVGMLPAEEESARDIDRGLTIDFQAAIARRLLELHFDPRTADHSLWKVYHAALLQFVQSSPFSPPAFPEVTDAEVEHAVRRMASRHLQEWDATKPRISEDVLRGLERLEEDFNIDRPTAKWAALTVGIEQALVRWRQPRKIRLGKPEAYRDGELTELPLIGLDDVGLAEVPRYHPHEDRLKQVQGFSVFVTEFRRRVFTEAESWLDQYRLDPKASLEDATPTVSAQSLAAPSRRSRYLQLLNDPQRLKREQRHLHLLFTAADERFPNHERQEAAEKLASEVFARPIHEKRWGAVLDKFEQREAVKRVRDATPGFLLEAIFEASQDQKWANYPELLAHIRSFLNSHLTEALLGPKWHRQVPEQDSGELEELVSPTEIYQRPDPVDVERQVVARRELERHSRRVEREAERLTQAQRDVYLLVKRDGFTRAEAAAELDITPPAARNRLKRAEAALGQSGK